MKNLVLTRREWLVGAGCVGLSMLPACGIQPALTDNTILPPYPSNAAEALERLQSGNQRFIENRPIDSHKNASWRNLLVEGQKPFATILGCSDSRVPPEMVFDVGFGDIFTIRLAGNIIAEDVIGTLQYAVAHLHTQLVVVMGHESCGAVTAAVEEMLGNTEELRYIGALISLMKPGLTEIDLRLDRANLLKAAVEANVRWSMQQLLGLPGAAQLMLEKQITLVGAVYELNSGRGRVRFLN